MPSTDPALKNPVHHSLLWVRMDQGSGSQLLKIPGTNCSDGLRSAACKHSTEKVKKKIEEESKPENRNMRLIYPVDLLANFIDVFAYI